MVLKAVFTIETIFRISGFVKKSMNGLHLRTGIIHYFLDSRQFTWLYEARETWKTSVTWSQDVPYCCIPEKMQCLHFHLFHGLNDKWIKANRGRAVFDGPHIYPSKNCSLFMIFATLLHVKDLIKLRATDSFSQEIIFKERKKQDMWGLKQWDNASNQNWKVHCSVFNDAFGRAMEPKLVTKLLVIFG